MQISLGMRKESKGGRVHGAGMGKSHRAESGAAFSDAVRPVARIWSSGHQPGSLAASEVCTLHPFPGHILPNA